MSNKENQEYKLHTISNIFEGAEIRSVWNPEKEDYYFSVVDVIISLTGSERPRKYWNDLKKKLLNEGSQLSEKVGQLKMKSSKDGKFYQTDVLNTEGILRLIESIPSPKAEPFKLWLSRLGTQEIDNVFDPSKGIDKMIDYYLNKGYSLEWIELRIKAIINRKKLTKTWADHGIKENAEYAILTNEIYKSWSDMTAEEYKKFKGIRKESLRDNMSDIEVALTDLGELATRELIKEHNPVDFEQNKILATSGGDVTKSARKALEQKLGKKVITNKNALPYQYLENNDKLK